MPPTTKTKTKTRKKTLHGFPQDLKKAIQGLNDETRQQIFLILYKHEPLSFSEIQTRLAKFYRVAKNTLAHHLKTLARSLLIEHFYEHKLGVEQYSYYKLSAYGRRIVTKLYQSLSSITPIKIK